MPLKQIVKTDKAPAGLKGICKLPWINSQPELHADQLTVLQSTKPSLPMGWSFAPAPSPWILRRANSSREM